MILRNISDWFNSVIALQLQLIQGRIDVGFGYLMACLEHYIVLNYFFSSIGEHDISVTNEPNSPMTLITPGFVCEEYIVA